MRGAGRRHRGRSVGWRRVHPDQSDAMSKSGAHERYQQVMAEITARRVETDIDPTVERVREGLDLLGDPQRTCRIIHLTGANGETSTAGIAGAPRRRRR